MEILTDENQHDELQEHLFVEELCRDYEKERKVDLSETLNIFWCFTHREYDNTTAALLTLAHAINSRTA